MAEEIKIQGICGQPKAEHRSIENSTKGVRQVKYPANELVLNEELLRLMKAL
jgi:hypothetical protein